MGGAARQGMGWGGLWVILIVGGVGIGLWGVSLLGSRISDAVVLLAGAALAALFARRDLAVFLTLAMPLVGAAVAVFLLTPTMPEAAHWAYLAGVGWWLLCTAAGAWFWPRWSTRVLRRARDPEHGFRATWDRVTDEVAAAESEEARWAALARFAPHAGPRTTPLIESWTALLDGWGRYRDERRMDRLQERIGELLRAYRGGLVALGGAWPNPDRPTEGTPLELLFPELEALVAEAGPSERRRMAVSAARRLWADLAEPRPEVEAALDAADGGMSDPSLSRRLAEEHARHEEDDDPAVTPAGELRSAVLSDATLASSVATSAEVEPRAAAAAIHAAARGMDDAGLSAFQEQLAAILSAEGRARAVEVRVDYEALDRWRAVRAARPVARDGLTAIAGDDLAIPVILLVGFVAGAGGTVLRALVWPAIRALPEASSLSSLVGLNAAALLAWLLLRLLRRPAGPGTVAMLLVGSAVSSLVEGWIVDMTAPLIFNAYPQVWLHVFVERTSALPFAPYHGVAFALVLLALAVFVRWPAWLARWRQRGSDA